MLRYYISTKENLNIFSSMIRLSHHPCRSLMKTDRQRRYQLLVTMTILTGGRFSLTVAIGIISIVDRHLRERARSKEIPLVVLIVGLAMRISSVHSSINELSVTRLHN